MRIWAELYDINENRLGEGPVWALLSARITEELDGIGEIQIQTPGTDERAFTLINTETRCRVFAHDFGVKTELGRGILTDVGRDVAAGAWTLTASGPDNLDEVKRRITRIGRTYSGQTLAAVVSDLMTLVPGWSGSCSKMDTVERRFDNVSVLDALQTLADEFGYHLRSDNVNQVVEIDDFGEPISDLVFINRETATPEVLINPNIALIESITVAENTQHVVNRLFPLGAGASSDAALTLEKATLSLAYPIQSVSQNGFVSYYIEDTASQAAVGVKEESYEFRKIRPISTSAADEIAGANNLYTASVERLLRQKQSRKKYKITVRKLEKSVRPGDKVRIVFKGVVETEGGLLTYEDIDDDFWVLSIRRSYTNEGGQWSFAVSNVDRFEDKSPAKLIVDTAKERKTQAVNVQPEFAHNTYGPWESPISSDTDASFKININAYAQKVRKATLYIQTSKRGVNYPSGLTVDVNGTQVATGLGSAGSALNTSVDVTDEINARVGGIQGDHTIDITASAGETKSPLGILGEIIDSVSATTPPGCLPCDGSQYAKSAYPELYAILASDLIVDANNFKTPDLRGRTIIGVGQGAGLTNRNAGDTPGAETHQLTEAEMPSHDHSPEITGYGKAVLEWGTSSTGQVGTIRVNNGAVNLDTRATGGLPTSTRIQYASTTDEGGDQPHNNMQPSHARHRYVVAQAGDASGSVRISLDIVEQIIPQAP